MPRFSVVIPVYNRAHLLLRTLQSVFCQTFQDFEIIIIDDGSDDDIAETMAAVTDPRVRFIRQSNAGASAARNAGVDSARGTFVAFLDSDDLFMPQHLQSMNNALMSREGYAVYSPVIVDRGNGNSFVKPPRGVAPYENMALYLICDRGFVQTSGLALSTEIARRIRYREDAVFGDDTDFAIRLDIAGCKFFMIDEPTVVWFDGYREDRLSLGRSSVGKLEWLEDIRSEIPSKAYHGYRGWHYAKSIYPQRPFLAITLFCRALLYRSYPASLAAVVFLQICLSDKFYRRLADWRVIKSGKNRLVYETSTNSN